MTDLDEVYQVERQQMSPHVETLSRPEDDVREAGRRVRELEVDAEAAAAVGRASDTSRLAASCRKAMPRRSGGRQKGSWLGLGASRGDER
jgi:hypothetical protein